MKTLTKQEYIDVIRAQGVPFNQVKFICPRCKTAQCAQDFIDTNKFTVDEVDKYLGFSCIGRWDPNKGCDWTLGGLFKIHELEVIDDDGTHYPMFMPANLVDSDA